MEQQPIEDGVIYCSFREIGIILPNKRFYKCIKPDVCCDTGCCNEQSYKFGTVWQYWQVVLLIVMAFIIISVIRYCCWLCKRKHTTRTVNNRRPLPTPPPSTQVSGVHLPTNSQRPYPTATTDLSHPPPFLRPVIGGANTNHTPTANANIVRNSGSVFSLGGLRGERRNRLLINLDNECANDHITEALVQRDRYGMNSMAATSMVSPYRQWGACREMTAGRRDERSDLGIRAIGGNTELTRDRIIPNTTTDSGDLALLTHLMALDIIYHSDNNPANNVPCIEKPPDYEQCLQELSSTVKLTDLTDDVTLPPTYDDICHEYRAFTVPPTPAVEAQTNDSVIYMVDMTGNVTSLTDGNGDCQQVVGV